MYWIGEGDQKTGDLWEVSAVIQVCDEEGLDWDATKRDRDGRRELVFYGASTVCRFIYAASLTTTLKGIYSYLRFID